MSILRLKRKKSGGERKESERRVQKDVTERRGIEGKRGKRGEG